MYGMYANIGGILMVNVTIYSSNMDPSWAMDGNEIVITHEKFVFVRSQNTLS